MKSFQQKRRFGNIIHSKLVLLFLGALVLVFAWGVVGFMGKMWVTAENRKIAESKLLELQIEKAKLSSDIAKLKTSEGVEESIREKFGLAKEGEGMIVVVEEKNSPEVEETSEEGFFSFFRNWFK